MRRSLDLDQRETRCRLCCGVGRASAALGSPPTPRRHGPRARPTSARQRPRQGGREADQADHDHPRRDYSPSPTRRSRRCRNRRRQGRVCPCLGGGKGWLLQLARRREITLWQANPRRAGKADGGPLRVDGVRPRTWRSLSVTPRTRSHRTARLWFQQVQVLSRKYDGVGLRLASHF